MFKFNFNLGDPNHENSASLEAAPSSNTLPSYRAGRPSPFSDTGSECHQVDLDQLLESLPPFISYSSIDFTGGEDLVEESIWRRDLYDARFQTYLDPQDQAYSDIEDEDKDQQSTRESVQQSRKTCKPETSKDPTRSNEYLQSLLKAPSDLVPGVYEGGLKTWESSLDLVAHFSRNNIDLATWLHRDSRLKEAFRVLEVGCGTALPTAWLLFKLFYALIRQDLIQENPLDMADVQPIEFHLQDFNQEVFYLLTLPNIILAFHRATLLATASLATLNQPPVSLPDPTGDLELTPHLISRFLDLLDRRNIRLRFFHGPWHAFLQASSTSHHYELIYSSETIYSPATLPSLVSLFKRAATATESRSATQLLVAAKKVYFGVGGSSYEFTRLVEALNGKVEIVWPAEFNEPEVIGVGRLIMSVTWPLHS